MFDALSWRNTGALRDFETLKVVLPVDATVQRRLKTMVDAPMESHSDHLQRRMQTQMDRDANQAMGRKQRRPRIDLRLIDQLDYYGKLSSQLEWQNGDNRPVQNCLHEIRRTDGIDSAR